MNDRIRQLRKYFDLTQQEFADRIGVKRNTIATYETGRNEPIDAVVSLICREFGVNEEWLRKGNGEMFRKPSDEIGYYVEDLLEYEGHGNPFYDLIIEMMKEYGELDDMSKTVIRDFFGTVLDGVKKKEGKED